MALLKGQKKKMLKDIVKYYVDTTDNTYDAFVQALLAYQCGTLDTSKYDNWLVNECITIMHENEITIQDCIENKDTLQTIVAEDKSRHEGEFYTPEVWCQEGRKYLKEMLGDQWGKIYIWDASAGTGNLMRTENYPQDKLFLSTLLPEDCDMLRAQFPEATVFQSNFVKDIDYDEYNKNFSNKLPEKLRQVLENDEPIVFYMNPPYKVGVTTDSDVGSYMMQKGLGKCGSDILHQFLYRICMIKRFYKLTHCYFGYFGSTTIYNKATRPLLNEILTDFEFENGMYFQAFDFANTSTSVGWVIQFSTWKTRTSEEQKPFKLDCKVQDVNTQTVNIVGERIMGYPEVLLNTWAKPNDTYYYTQSPTFTTMNVAKNFLSKKAVNSMGQIMCDNFAIRGTHRCAVSTEAMADGLDITEENFYRCVASFAARVLYRRVQTPLNNCQFYSKPDTEIEGYDTWIKNCLVIFLFDWACKVKSYRGFENCGQKWDISNPFFNLSVDTVKSIVTDQNIIEDINQYPVDNSFVLGVLEEAKKVWYPEVMDLYNFCETIMIESLKNDVRKKVNYENDLVAWDASFVQLRDTEHLWTEALEMAYREKMIKVKNILQYGIFKYKFLINYKADYSDLIPNDVEEFTSAIISDDSDM